MSNNTHASSKIIWNPLVKSIHSLKFKSIKLFIILLTFVDFQLLLFPWPHANWVEGRRSCVMYITYALVPSVICNSNVLIS